jgi:hypothetical protein
VVVVVLVHFANVPYFFRNVVVLDANADISDVSTTAFAIGPMQAVLFVGPDGCPEFFY